ncbi:MAG: hypothetical protein QOG15_818 [Solirubrobacteraceae bacterium]|nr:hypothetical protein [Solirubrobacteraceae bacterium]
MTLDLLERGAALGALDAILAISILATTLVTSLRIDAPANGHSLLPADDVGPNVGGPAPSLTPLNRETRPTQGFWPSRRPDSNRGPLHYE